MSGQRGPKQQRKKDACRLFLTQEDCPRAPRASSTPLRPIRIVLVSSRASLQCSDGQSCVGGIVHLMQSYVNNQMRCLGLSQADTCADRRPHGAPPSEAQPTPVDRHRASLEKNNTPMAGSSSHRSVVCGGRSTRATAARGTRGCSDGVSRAAMNQTAPARSPRMAHTQNDDRQP